MADESNSYRDVFSRRRFMELAGVSGAAAIAGCDGSGDGGTEDDDESGSSVQDYAMTNWVGDDTPNNLHFNVYNTNSLVPFSQFIVWEPTTKYDYGAQEYKMWGISDWEMTDDTTFQISINTDITWDNGDSLTAQDVATQLKLEEVIGSALWDFADSAEVVDDSTIELNLPDGGNPELIKIFLNNTYLHTKHSEFEQYLDGVGDDADETVANNLRSLEIAGEDVVSNGPFGSPEANEQRLRLNRQDTYHNADQINFNEYQMQYIDGNQSVWQELIGGNLDAVWSLFTPPRIIDQFSDSMVEARIAANWGYGLCPQHDNEHVGKKKVRQAIMHVINRDQVVENAGPRTKKTPEIPTCVATDTQTSGKAWLEGSTGEFKTYGKGSTNTDKAEQLLDEAGYSKDGGTWKMDGKAVSLPVMVPSGWSDWNAATRTVTDQLSEFGFKSSPDAQGGSFWDNVFSGNFTLTAWNWLVGAVRGTHPYFNADYHFALAENGGPGYNYSAPEEASTKVTSLSTATDEQEAKSLVVDLAKMSNERLPIMAITEKDDQSFVNGDRLSIPDAGSDKYNVKWPSAWLVRNGDIKAKTQ